MLIAIVLDRPLAEVQELVNTPGAFIQALTTTIQDKKNHPVIVQMIQPDTSEDVAPAEGSQLLRSHSQGAAKARLQHIRISNSIRARGNVRFSRLLFLDQGQGYLDQRQRSHWSPWGTLSWRVHLWPSRGGQTADTSRLTAHTGLTNEGTGIGEAGARASKLTLFIH